MKRHDTHNLSDESEKENKEENYKYTFNNTKNSNITEEKFITKESEQKSSFHINNLNNQSKNKNYNNIKENQQKENNISIISSKDLEDIFYNEDNNKDIPQKKKKAKKNKYFIKLRKIKLNNEKNDEIIENCLTYNLTLRNDIIDKNIDIKRKCISLNNLDKKNNKNIDRTKLKKSKKEETLKEKEVLYFFYNDDNDGNQKLKNVVNILNKNKLELLKISNCNFTIRNKIKKTKRKLPLLNKNINNINDKKNIRYKYKSNDNNNNILKNNQNHNYQKNKNNFQNIKNNNNQSNNNYNIESTKNFNNQSTKNINNQSTKNIIYQSNNNYNYQSNNNYNNQSTKNKDNQNNINYNYQSNNNNYNYQSINNNKNDNYQNNKKNNNNDNDNNDNKLEKDVKIKKINYNKIVSNINLNKLKNGNTLNLNNNKKLILKNNASNITFRSQMGKTTNGNISIRTNKNCEKMEILYNLYCGKQSKGKKSIQRIQSAQTIFDNKDKGTTFVRMNNYKEYEKYEHIHNNEKENRSIIEKLYKIQTGDNNTNSYNLHFGNNDNCPFCQAIEKKNEQNIKKMGIFPMIPNVGGNDNSQNSWQNRRVYSALSRILSKRSKSRKEYDGINDYNNISKNRSRSKNRSKNRSKSKENKSKKINISKNIVKNKGSKKDLIKSNNNAIFRKLNINKSNLMVNNFSTTNKFLSTKNQSVKYN